MVCVLRMKYSKRQMETIRENLKFCKWDTRYGVFTVNKAESLEHNLKLAEQFVILSYEGFCVAIRPELKNGSRPDLLVLNTKHPIAKEIMVTEKEERFAKKNYLGAKKIKVRC